MATASSFATPVTPYLGVHEDGLVPAADTLLITEVHDRRAASHALHPEILQPRDVVGNIHRRHDHLGGERFVVGIAGPVEVGLAHDRSVTGCSGI